MSAIQELAPYLSAYQSNIKRAKEDQHYTIDRLVEESGVSRSAVTKLCAGTQQDPKLYNSAALCRVLGLSLDELCGLVKPAESPEELTEQIHHVEIENAKLEVEKPFPQEDELKRKSARLDELNILLNMDKRESEIVDGDVGDEVTAPARGSPDRER